MPRNVILKQNNTKYPLIIINFIKLFHKITVTNVNIWEHTALEGFSHPVTSKRATVLFVGKFIHKFVIKIII